MERFIRFRLADGGAVSYGLLRSMGALIDEGHRVEILAACRRRDLGGLIHVERGKSPRFNVATQPLEQNLQVVGWNQLERIGAGEDVASVLGGKQ